jgi:hypothetical protein
MIRVEVGSSIPYLSWNLDHSSFFIGSIKEAGLIQRKEFFSFHCKSARCFILLLF